MRYTRLALAIAGLAAIGYGVLGTLTDAGSRPLGQLRFLATVLIGHDLVVLPIALAAGAVVARWAPRWARGSIAGALFASAVVTVVALPFLIGTGRDPANPSALPLPYGRGLLLVLAVIWVAAALTSAAVRWRTRSRPLRTPPER